MFEQPRKGLFKGPFYAIPGHEEYKKRFLGKTIMNNKTYIVLLSSFIACTSMGMEKVPSLLECAAKPIAQQIHDAVVKGAKALKASGELTEASVKEDQNEALKSIDNLPLDMKNAVIKAYRKLCTTKEKSGYYKQNIDHSWAANWKYCVQYVEDEDGDRFFLNYATYGHKPLKGNAARNRVACIKQESKENIDENHLYVWQESPTGWQRKYLGKMGYVYDLVWGRRDDSLVILSKGQIDILQTPDENGFRNRCSMPYPVCRDGYYIWMDKKKVLAIEKRLQPDSNDRRADVDLLQIKDNNLQVIQTLSYAKNILGIRWFAAKSLQCLVIWHKGHYASWKESDGKWIPEKEEEFSEGGYKEDRTDDPYEPDPLDPVCNIEERGKGCFAVIRESIPLYEIPKKIIRSLEDTKQ
jgi:hypothetical protein